LKLNRRFVLATLSAVLLIAVTGCGSSSSSSSSTSKVAEAAKKVKSAVHAAPERGIVKIQMATVGDPGNKSVGVVQTFVAAEPTQAGAAGEAEAEELAQSAPSAKEARNGEKGGIKAAAVQPPVNSGIYPTCASAPKAPRTCLMVGGVKETFGIGKFEVTVDQYVTFLNTVDPSGKNPRELYFENMSSKAWPEYGPIKYSPDAGASEHYAVAYPEWAQKPFGFTNFRRAARFVNSMDNGTVLSQKASSEKGFKYVTYEVRLSPKTEQGMYDLRDKSTERTKSSGFVLPSNDEWVKAAYYDPKHGGTDSYWKYTTGPGETPPSPSKLNPNTGEVVNATTQPLATYNPNNPESKLDSPGSPPGPAPTWCPPQAGKEACETVYPMKHLSKAKYLAIYQANMSNVGEAGTPSPWGTYDQGGNAVEWTDTIAPQPPGHHFARVWRYLHGGVTNAPAWQVGISAFGYIDQDNKAVDKTYPWQGFRVGVIGSP
jgi:formylglycine-generating enzyme required for sulfatase activity